MFCCTLLNVHFSLAIILMGKRKLVALLSLSYWCLVMLCHGFVCSFLLWHVLIILTILWVRGWLSMGMVVIQPYILVSELKKTKTRFLRCDGYRNSIKHVWLKDLKSRCYLHIKSKHCANFEHPIKWKGSRVRVTNPRLILSTFDFGSYIGDLKPSLSSPWWRYGRVE